MRSPRKIVLLFTIGLVAGCGSPAAPDDGASKIVALGPQMLRILLQAPCSRDLGIGVLPMIHTHVSVERASSEWVATAASPAAGDVQVRFRQSAQSVLPGSFSVTGSISGTAVHIPALFTGPAWDVRGTFNGQASLTGVAFAAGSFGATSSGLDGTGSGSLTMTSPAGTSCTGSTFSWLIAPVP
jgi:hypothetical protein